MTPSTHVQARSVHWPPERFYWAVLDANGWRGRGPLPLGLLPQLQEELPVPVDDVHAVSAGPSGDGPEILVCAALRSDLASIEPETLRLGPSSLPPEIAAPDGDAAAVNLLIGDYEPAPIRLARRRQHRFAAATVLLTATLLAVGLVRREQHWLAAAAEHRLAAMQLLEQAGLPADAPHAVEQELARVQHLAGAGRRFRPPADAAPALAALLKTWPTAVPARPVALEITADHASAGVIVEGDAAPFLSALVLPAGWTMDEPRLQRSEAHTRVSLELRSTPGARP